MFVRPPDRAHRAAQATALHRRAAIARAADEHRQVRRTLAPAWLRRKPGGTAREFAAYVVAAAAAGLREEEAAAPGAEQTVQVMTMHAAKGLEFDYVYVLGTAAEPDAGGARGRRRSRSPTTC